MDYETINQAVEDIISIVNHYNSSRQYPLSVCEKLVVTLLGYYLVFGPSIFEKIQVVLSQLRIYECEKKDDYREQFRSINSESSVGSLFETYNPVAIWDYQYDAQNKFIGAIPYILYVCDNFVTDVLTMSHELSHLLDGVSAKVVEEDEEFFTIQQSFTHVLVRKNDNSMKIEEQGFSEMVTITIENHILKSLLALEEEKIQSPVIKEFLQFLQFYKGRNVLSRSYLEMSGLFKDLIDNDAFFSLIEKYYYANDEDGFEAEFNSFDAELSYRKIKRCAIHMASLDYNEVIYYSRTLRQQLDIFNRATHFEPDQRILIMV